MSNATTSPSSFSASTLAAARPERLQEIMNGVDALAIDLYRTMARTPFPEPIHNLKKGILRLPDASRGGVSDEEFLKACLTTPYEDTNKYLDDVARQLDLGPIPSDARREFAALVEEEKFGLLVYSDVKQNLKRLKQFYKLALVTNSWPFPVTKLLKESGMESLFDVVISSSAVGFSKQDGREIYDITATRLNVPPHRIAMIGDNPELDGVSSMQAGYNAILCDRGPYGLLDSRGEWIRPEVGLLQLPVIRDFNQLPNPVRG